MCWNKGHEVGFKAVYGWGGVFFRLLTYAVCYHLGLATLLPCEGRNNIGHSQSHCLNNTNCCLYIISITVKFCYQQLPIIMRMMPHRLGSIRSMSTTHLDWTELCPVYEQEWNASQCWTIRGTQPGSTKNPYSGCQEVAISKKFASSISKMNEM